MWGRASFASETGHAVFSSPASEKTEQPTGLHGPVTTTSPKSKPNGSDTYALISARIDRQAKNTPGWVIKKRRDLHQRMHKEVSSSA